MMTAGMCLALAVMAGTTGPIVALLELQLQCCCMLCSTGEGWNVIGLGCSGRDNNSCNSAANAMLLHVVKQ